MAGYVIEHQPDEQIILVTLLDDWVISRYLAEVLARVWNLLEAADSPMFFVVDSRVDPKASLDELMLITTSLLRGRHPVLRHPKLLEHLVATENRVVIQILKSLPWRIARAFPTIDEALVYARQKLAD